MKKYESPEIEMIELEEPVFTTITGSMNVEDDDLTDTPLQKSQSNQF